MDLVGRGVKSGDEYGEKGPAQLPAPFGDFDGAKKQQAKNEIFAHMGAFADEVVQRYKRVFRRMRKERMKDTNYEALRVLARERVRRKSKNDGCPHSRKEPRAKTKKSETIPPDSWGPRE